MKIPFYSLTYQELNKYLEENCFSTSASSKLYNWFYKKNKRENYPLNVSKITIDHLNENFSFILPRIKKLQTAEDNTTKFLFELDDGFEIESVLIPFNNKFTLCISSQVGCAMGCSFCHTGIQGLKRNLKTEEIVGQYLKAKEWLSENLAADARILNIVFMGQGEPLHNFDPVRKSCEIFLSQHGLSIADHKITISTAGYLPGLKRWQEEMPKVNIALSLHSPFIEKRNELIPINKRYPLEEVLKYVESIPEGKKRFVTYEYLIINNFNDSDDDAHETGKLLAGKNAYVSLIPFNPFPSSHYKRPTVEKVLHFKEILDEYKIPTLVRITKGDEILAACGQLNTML